MHRRKFLKKAVYHAPVLYVLGRLSKPTPVHADFSGGPPGPPGGGGPFFSSSAAQKRAPKRRKTLRF